MKDIFVLGMPTLAMEQLSDLFYNQIATYNEIREFDKEEEGTKNEVCTFDSRSQNVR